MAAKKKTQSTKQGKGGKVLTDKEIMNLVRTGNPKGKKK